MASSERLAPPRGAIRERLGTSHISFLNDALQKEAGPETILSPREVVFVSPNGQLANRFLVVVSPDCLLNLLSAGVWRDDQEFSIAVLPQKTFRFF